MSTVPTNPPANPIPGSVYVDLATNVAYVWTGTGWVPSSGSTGYNTQITTGAAILPGYFPQPNPSSYIAQVGSEPTNPSEGQIWVNDTITPAPVYVRHDNAWVLIADGTFTNTTVAAMPPATPDIGDSYYETATNRFYVWDGTTWQNVTNTTDTHSIASALQPTTRSDGSSLQAGDMWINTNTSAVSYWKGSWFPIASAASTSTVATAFFLASTAPAVGAEGDCYYNTTEDTLYVSNGTTWVAISDTNTAVSTTQPAATSVLWVDTSAGAGNEVLKYYDPGTASWLPAVTTSGPDTQGYAAAGDPNSTAPFNTTTDSNGRSFATGDNYVDTATNALYYRNGAAWAAVATGGVDTQGYNEGGDPNATAPFNTTTDNSGRSFLKGDFYWDNQNAKLYVRESGTSWTQIFVASPDVVGYSASGDPNSTSPYNGTADPDGRSFSSGDNYVDTATSVMYYRDNAAWTPIATGGTGTATATATPTIEGVVFGSATTSANGNVYLGENAGLSNSTFSNGGNTFIGAEAGRQNMGVGNVFIGNGNAGVTGAATANVCIGGATANALATGNDNVHVGNGAGGGVTSSSGNVLIGRSAGSGVTSGNANVFIGQNSGSEITSGGNNIFIGGFGGGVGSLSDYVVIGRPADSSTVVLQVNDNNAFGFPTTTAVNNSSVDFGTNGQVLTSQGSALNPIWTSPTVKVPGETTSVSPNWTVPTYNIVVVVGGTATTPVTVNMTAASVLLADTFTVIDDAGNAGTNNITVTLANHTFHDGSSSQTISTNYGRLTAIYSNTTGRFWFKLD